MNQTFENRPAAGRLLAEKLAFLSEQPGLTVLALPRGGVPVAAEIAHRLKAVLDVLVVRKVGAPANPELALGAIASGGFRVLNHRVMEEFGVSPVDFNRLAAREAAELNRREREYRQGRPAPAVRQVTVILVDDGIATGSSMRVAVTALRQAGAGRIIVAAPVAARESYLELREHVSDFITLALPRHFGSVAEFYANFEPTTDAEVRELLHHAWQEQEAVVAG